MTDLLEKGPAAIVAGTLAGAQYVPVSPCDVEARGLSKRFGDTSIFSNVSFRLARGEAVAIVGANGTGKSTLLRCVMGLIPPTEGSALLLGQQITDATRRELRALRSQTGMVAQKHNLVPRLSVLSNVIHGLLGQRGGPAFWAQGLAPEPAREAAMTALQNVGLAHLANRRADRLSGGQSQRVAIARALVGKPKVLFADEPCASLDPAAGEEVMELFFNLAREQGVTVVFVSHHMDHALQFGDRVIGLAGGKLQLDATAASLTQADLRGLYD